MNKLKIFEVMISVDLVIGYDKEGGVSVDQGFSQSSRPVDGHFSG